MATAMATATATVMRKYYNVAEVLNGNK